MTTKKAAPWDNIRRPEADYNVRLVSGEGPISLYWGRDSEGRCLFIVELEGDNTALFKKSDIAVNGIGIDLRLLDAMRSQALVLTLEQPVDRDLFFGLCQTLIKSLQNAGARSEALILALGHLRRWKVFLAGRKARVLTPAEVRGLFGELQFLRLLYQQLPVMTAIEAWCGPNGGHQDFIFGDTAAETKTISGRERNTVRISSEDQLESTCGNLFLAIFRLVESEESSRALSLNDAVRLVESELSDPSALEEFWNRLGASGYTDIKQYDAPKFIVAGQRLFRVDDSFPRLIRSRLPSGITKVSYDIQLEDVESFECPAEQIWRQ